METILVNLTAMLFIKEKHGAEIIMRICIVESPSSCGNKQFILFSRAI